MEQTTDIWEKYVPKSVELYYVGYNDNLEDHIEDLQECLENNALDHLYEIVYDFWNYPQESYLDEIESRMAKDGLQVVFEAHKEDIEMLLNDRDSSTPVDNLLNNTSPQPCYYSLGYEVDGWHEAFMAEPWRNTSEAQEAANVRRKLGIKKGSAGDDLIRSIVNNSSYGGELRIYFNGNLKDMITEGADFKTITFKGEFVVAVYNCYNGSGDYDIIELDCDFPFIRENLSYSETDRYPIEECFGMYNDWLNNKDTPTFSLEGTSKKVLDNTTRTAARNAEKKYRTVFKSGGCTYGDTDIRRHRDVTYDNNSIPCGWHCPHCGQFWID